MAFKADLEQEVKKILQAEWKTREGKVVPNAGALSLDNDAVELKAAVLYADMADSTVLVDRHERSFAAEIYKAYLRLAARIINNEMGKQKGLQSSSLHQRTSSPGKSVPASQQQAIAGKASDNGQNMPNNVSYQALQALKLHDQEEEVTKAAFLLFEHIEGQINLADTKAQLTLAADALLAGTFAVLGKGAVSNLLSNTSPILDRLADLSTVLMFLALVCSFYYALRVINPHLQGSKRFTLMYFGQIAQMDEDDFIDTFRNQSLSDLKASTLAQVHTKAKIAQVKFARASRSVNFLILSLIFWAISQLLLAFL